MTEHLKKFLKDGPVYMTQDEGMGLAEMGLITPDVAQVSPKNPNAVLVTLTEEGQKRLNKMTEPKPALPPIAPSSPVEIEEPSTPAHWAISDGLPPTEIPVASDVKIDSDIPVPKMKRVAPKTKKKPRYPFDELEIGQSFHLPATEDQPEPWKNVARFLTAANTKSKLPVEPHEMVKVTKKRIVLDENGEKMKEKGKLVYEKYQIEELKTAQTKKFICRRVGQDDPAGEGARVFRVSLDHED